MSTTNSTPPVEQVAFDILADSMIYIARDRFVCSSPQCAGSTARATGYDIDGHKLRAVDAGDVAEWKSYALGPLTCECGRITA